MYEREENERTMEGRNGCLAKTGLATQDGDGWGKRIGVGQTQTARGRETEMGALLLLDILIPSFQLLSF